MLVTPLGNLRPAVEIFKSAGTKELWINFLNDKLSADVVFRRMKAQKTLELAHPNTELGAIEALYSRVKRRLTKEKSNPLKSVEEPDQIFHLHRRWKQDKSHFLHRMVFGVDANWNFMLKGEKPVISFLEKSVPKQRGEGLLMSLKLWEGLKSANEWFKKGVDVPALGRKIYPLYGVWSPTTQGYVDMLKEYLDREAVGGSALDLGCGTGVLSLMLAQRGVRVTAVDCNPRAVECTRMNAEMAGLELTAVESDCKQPLELGKQDLVLCNPPWLPVSAHSPMDLGSYDPNEALLKSSFIQAKHSLTPAGRFLLIHSDFASNLKLQAPDRIQDLCSQHGLRIKSQQSIPFPETFDSSPLQPFKSKSQVFLYDMRLD